MSPPMDALLTMAPPEQTRRAAGASSSPTRLDVHAHDVIKSSSVFVVMTPADSSTPALLKAMSAGESLHRHDDDARARLRG